MPQEPCTMPPEWGYLLTEPPYPEAPGGQVLTLCFRPQPTGEHFDPDKASFPVVLQAAHGPLGDRFALSEVKVGHPWEGPTTYQGAPGQIRAWDHKGREVTWFTFGGTLTLASSPRCTLARFTSPAPIVEMGPEDEVILLFAEEAEELLAQRKAAHLPDRLEVLAARVHTLDPWLLYCVVLRTLEAKLAQLRKLPLEERLWEYLNRQITRLQEEDRCPRRLPSIEEIL